jgi:hypothetical protein
VSALGWALFAFRLARQAPQILRLLADLIMIFTPDAVDRKVEAIRDEAIRMLDKALTFARRAVREVENLDFGQGVDGNKNARFFEVVTRTKTTMAALGHELGETDARAIAQNAVKLERSEGVASPSEVA